MKFIKKLFKEKYRIIKRFDGKYEVQIKKLLRGWVHLATHQDHFSAKSHYDKSLRIRREENERERLSRKYKTIEETTV